MNQAGQNHIIQEEFVPREKYEQLLSEYEYIKQQLAELKRVVFGSKSERFIACPFINKVDLNEVE